MKITINVDCTPEEARSVMGLPDVSTLNDAMIEEMKKRVENGFSSEDVDKMMNTWMTGASAGMGEMQKAFFSMIPGADKK